MAKKALLRTMLQTRRMVNLKDPSVLVLYKRPRAVGELDG